MASGIEMMLKSMGFDPEKLKAQLTQAQTVLTDKVTEIESKLTSIQDSMLRIEIKLNTLPVEMAQKLLTDNAPSIAELERIYGGRNDHDNGNGNNGDGR